VAISVGAWLLYARTIRIASDTHHAQRACGYIRELAPQLFDRLAPTWDFVPLELGPVRLPLTFYDAMAATTAARRDMAADPVLE